MPFLSNCQQRCGCDLFLESEISGLEGPQGHLLNQPAVAESLACATQESPPGAGPPTPLGGLWASRQTWMSASLLLTRNLHLCRVLWVTRDTNWLLSFPAPQCDPPLEVTDLFVDIQDGKILMALLEVLSGRNLVRTLQEEEVRHRKHCRGFCQQTGAAPPSP